MHSSTAFLVLALAASVAPSLSAPVYGRDVELVFSRNSPTAPAGAADQSGAISFGKIFKGIFGREDGELLARE